ncbi:MAG: hypothetical protein ACRDEA_08260 [Microcystaceae cyanobacterium]
MEFVMTIILYTHSDERRQSMSIYVRNLSYEVTQEDLTKVFADYGVVK